MSNDGTWASILTPDEVSGGPFGKEALPWIDASEYNPGDSWFNSAV